MWVSKQVLFSFKKVKNSLPWLSQTINGYRIRYGLYFSGAPVITLASSSTPNVLISKLLKAGLFVTDASRSLFRNCPSSVADSNRYTPPASFCSSFSSHIFQQQPGITENPGAATGINFLSSAVGILYLNFVVNIFFTAKNAKCCAKNTQLKAWILLRL